MSEINYKSKYEQLKLKFMNSVDMAYRLGYEDGAKQQEMNQMQQQAQQQAEMEQAQQGQPGQPGQEGAEGEEQPQEEQMSAHPGGSELDQHIAQLESMLGKSELSQHADIRKSLDGLKAARKAQLLAIDLIKSEKAIKGIAKAMSKPKFTINKTANHNMNSNAKAALSLQEKIVNDVMKSWSEEENRVSSDIKNILSVEGLTKKE